MLLFFIILPVFIEAPFLINIWLWKIEIPQYAVIFSRLILIVALIDTLSYPFMTAIQATGNIKWYQIVVGGVIIMVLPVSYIVLKLTDSEPTIVLWILIGTSVISQILRTVFMKRQLDMRITSYITKVIIPVTVVSVVSIAVAVTAKKLLGEGVWQSLTEIAVCLTCSGITIYFLGMTKTEKRHFVEMIFKFLKKQMK
jgi:hypothetical protein